MSNRRKALKRQKKANSPAQKQKQAKKAYYASNAAKEKWAEKQKRKYEKLEQSGML